MAGQIKICSKIIGRPDNWQKLNYIHADIFQSNAVQSVWQSVKYEILLQELHEAAYFR